MSISRNILVTFFLVTTGLIFSGIAAFMFFQQYNLQQKGLEAQGTVVQVVSRRDSDGDITYTPVIRFRTDGGREVEFQSTYSSNPPQYEVGETVTVLYLPERPTEAEIKGAGNLLIVIFGIFGGLDLLIAIFMTGKTIFANLNSE